ITSLLAAIDVFALSSLTEGISISLLEAMAQEKPCVVTAVGGNPEVITDGVNGRLVPPRNPEKLAEALRELISDYAKAASYGRHARKTVETSFSIEAMMLRLDAEYARALRGVS
ncbi:MAG: glycosyltransferase, partial [Candidatus Omnitrophica bacterium]|nr:glycosyltransferase [Candidatus Omnitrophota bacterium]